LLIGFGIGLIASRTTDFFSFSASIETSVSQQPSAAPIWLQLLIFYGYPVLLLAALYFFYLTWRDWCRARAFSRGKARADATITHLWKEPPSGSGKKYYAGYAFGLGQSAYQQVDVWTYKRLAVGQSLPVEYLPNDPGVSRLDLARAKPARKTRTDRANPS
jgi:hypothetical protein